MAKGSRLSVAELAGRFTCQAPFSSENEASKPVRRRPPRTLPLPASNDVGQGQDEKAEVGSHPPRKNRNSALIEKLQASLSPTALLPSPLSPGAGKHLPFFPPHSPCSPVSPTVAPQQSQLEIPASFETPAEGLMLPNINKSRARHSIKRRPPSRRLRQSIGDEGGSEEETALSPGSESSAPDETENVFEKKENTDLASTTSNQQQDQQENEAAVDSGQQPLTSPGGVESTESFVSAEKEETVEEEQKSEQPEVDSSKEEDIKQEPDNEMAKETPSEPATENKIVQEVKKEEDSKEVEMI